MIFNVCFTCTRWHVKVSGSFMFSWNYWLMMGMSYEQNTMGKGPNLSPWGLVNERPRKKMWERRRHRKPWALAMRREMRRVTWRKVARFRARWSGVTKWEGVGWIAGRNESISKCAWQIAGLAIGLLHIPCESKKTRWSPRTRMLTRMLMVQMSKHMVMQSRTIPFCNSLFEQSCTCFPCYQSAVWSGKCRVWSVECEVRSVECKVWSGECRVCKV